MHKFVIFVLFFVSVSANAAGLNSCKVSDSLVSLTDRENSLDFQTVDSITYQYYLAGKWNELIETGKEAISQQIDYKRLRQRIGYAYYMKADYYAAMKHYEAALDFDKTDLDTRAYLYYCGLYTVNESYARYQAGKLPIESQKFMNVKPFKIVDAIDVEYNYKSNDSRAITKDSLTRSNPTYWRIGINSKLGYQLSLYQAFSSYTQRIDSINSNMFINLSRHTNVTQNEYYAGLSWKPLTHFEFMVAYHLIKTVISDSTKWQVQPELGKSYHFDTIIPLIGNMFLGKIAFKYNRFDVDLSGSLLNYNNVLTQQYTLQAAVTLPGLLNVRLKSKIDAMIIGNEGIRPIFTQTVGIAPLKKIWVEGNVTLGNLKNYADYDGLYILNSKDPSIIFKTGATILWQALNKVSFFGNYGYDIKQLKTNTNYNQHSFAGGIIWKI